MNINNNILYGGFDYPTKAIIGYEDVNDITLPTSVELVSDYEEGDYYKAYLERQDGLILRIAETELFVFGGAFTSGDKVYYNLKSQTPGSKYTGRIHYRLYKMDKNEVFYTDGVLEKVIYRKSGSFSIPSGVPFYTEDITTDVDDTMYFRGRYRVGGGVWRSVNSSVGGDVAMYLEGTTESSVQKLNLYCLAGTNGYSIDYDIVGVRLYGEY